MKTETTATATLIDFPTAAAARKGRQAERRAFLEKWLRRVIGHPELTLAHRLVLVAIGFYWNFEQRTARVGYRRLASDTAQNISTAIRAVNQGETTGLLSIRRGNGRKIANVYTLILPGESGEKGCTPATLSAATSEQKQWHACTETVARVHTVPLLVPLKESRGASRNGAIKKNGAGKTYAFTGQVLRITQAQIERWGRAYPLIPDIVAGLQACDDYIASEEPSKHGNVFFRASAWLKRKHDKHAEKCRAAERERYSW